MNMSHDLRYALRQMRRNPGFTAVAVITLALGIGSNTAIFSLLNQVLLKALPVRAPEQLVTFHFEGVSEGSSRSDNDESVFSYPTYRDLRDRGGVFNGVIARASAAETVLAENEAERLGAEVVSGNFFPVLGVRPALGRLLSESDDTGSGNPVVVLSHEYWQRRFGGSPSALNRTIRVSGRPMTIVGVVHRNFRSVVSGQTPDIYIPIAGEDQKKLSDHRWHWLNIFGRLRPGFTREQAQASLAPLYRNILLRELDEMKKSQRFRDRFLSSRLELRPASRGINQLQLQWRKPLIAVMAMVGLVLLIACVNVANLLISRGAARRKETAIRLAIGAGRLVLAREHLVESLALSLLGGTAGVLSSWWIAEGLLHLLPADATGGWLRADMDSRLLAFSFALTVITAVLFGMAPAIHSVRTDAITALREQTSTGSRTHVRFRQGLVAAQIAFSFVLLIAAGLFVRSFAKLLDADPGFRPRDLLVFNLNPALNGYTDAQMPGLIERLRTQLSALPGVVSIAVAKAAPFGHANMFTNMTVEGYRAGEDEDTTCAVNAVSAGYFSTLGIPLVAGREFTAADAGKAPKVALINQAFARHFFANRNPLGMHITSGSGNVKPDVQIAGIVRDSSYGSLREKTSRFHYLPLAQSTEGSRVTFLVRANSASPSLTAGVRRAVRDIDPAMPVADMQWMQTQIEDSVYIERLTAMLAAAFGALATLLAGIGLYGVLAYVTARRTAEIGVRMALGATRRDIVKLVMLEVWMVVLAGLIVGVPCALAASRLIQSQLFGVRAADPLVMLTAAAVLGLAAMAAAWLPARRATEVDPLTSIRHE